MKTHPMMKQPDRVSFMGAYGVRTPCLASTGHLSRLAPLLLCCLDEGQGREGRHPPAFPVAGPSESPHPLGWGGGPGGSDTRRGPPLFAGVALAYFFVQPFSPGSREASPQGARVSMPSSCGMVSRGERKYCIGELNRKLETRLV